MEAPADDYEKCGFTLKITEGTLDVRAIDAASGELMVSCSLSVAIWGPKGNFTVDPDEDGILVHIPVRGQAFTKPTTIEHRKFIEHGKWFIDIFYGLSNVDRNILDRELEEVFDISSERDGSLYIQRKFMHKMYQYKWPYVLCANKDGSLRFSLRRSLLGKLIVWLRNQYE